MAWPITSMLPESLGGGEDTAEPEVRGGRMSAQAGRGNT